MIKERLDPDYSKNRMVQFIVAYNIKELPAFLSGSVFAHSSRPINFPQEPVPPGPHVVLLSVGEEVQMDFIHQENCRLLRRDDVRRLRRARP